MPVINYTVESESPWTLRGTQSSLFKDDLGTLEDTVGSDTECPSKNLLINKASSVLTEKNIRIRKTFTPLNSVKKVQFRSQNKTLPKVKILRRTKKHKKVN